MARFKAELGMEPTVVATGGHGRLIASESEVIDEVNEELTLVGLEDDLRVKSRLTRCSPCRADEYCCVFPAA